ncbi:hypothetical protein P691DRAFT_759284 [Macrolepiota fuliginosa MF-IS2]|uniref:DUF6534 domain-containing protein n=1 Tax=Macrolepiota fuliginosa MF-IS2 TaxID=1400762 RepID=A0A9P6C5E1_9AGAR|nr:hypothetical protein P691DRAFT_759284 [Macrolepiota fuliginosa MF-IS2]
MLVAFYGVLIGHIAVLVFTEICCGLVELFFILRLCRFAEKKRLAIFVFPPYIASVALNLVYLQGMIRLPCFPDSLAARSWLLSAYSLKILSDGIIAGTMIWMLYHRSRGVRSQGGTIRVIRALIYWTASTGLVLWLSTIVHLLTYTLLPATYVSLGIYLTRGRIYVIAMLAV